MRRPTRLLVTVLVLMAAATAIVAPSGTAGAGQKAEKAQKTETITLVTHDSFALSEDVLAAFTKRTGIEVEIVPLGDAGQLVNQAILTKDNPLGDVLFGVDNTFLTRALDAGIFEPYRSKELFRVRPFLDVDRAHRVTPIDTGDVCINYDKEWFAKKGLTVPKTLTDLTKPKYRDLLVVEDPSTSSPGLGFLLATVAEFGENGWIDYWKQLRDNDVTVVDGWEQAYYDEFSGGGGGGEKPLVVSYASSPAAAVVFADPPIDESPIGTMTASCFRQVEFAGVLAGTEHRAAARQLVDFLLSDAVQSDIPLQMFVYPAITDARLPKVFADNADTAENAYWLSPARIGAHRDDWIREWTGTVLR